MKFFENLGCFVVGSPLVIAALILRAAWTGIFVVPMWRWFVVPVTGWPDLTMLGAVGLAGALSLLHPSGSGLDSFYEKERHAQADAAFEGEEVDRNWAKFKHFLRNLGISLLVAPTICACGWTVHVLQGWTT